MIINYSFTLQILIKYLLCTWHYYKCWSFRTDISLPPWHLYSRQEDKNEQVNKIMPDCGKVC